VDGIGVGGMSEAGGEVEDGGNDAGRAVSGGGDDAAAGGILLVDGEGVEVDPVEDGEGIGEGGFVEVAEILVEFVGAAADVEAAGEGALGGAAVADAFLHGDPDGVEALAGFGLGAEAGFVSEGEFGDGVAGGFAVGEEFGAGVVGEGDLSDGSEGGSSSSCSEAMKPPPRE